MSEDDEPSWVEEQTSERVRKFESRVSSSSSSPQLSPEPLAEEPADTIAISDPSFTRQRVAPDGPLVGAHDQDRPFSSVWSVLWSSRWMQRSVSPMMVQVRSAGQRSCGRATASFRRA